ncbi:FtsK/SpoIIIE domain-containing protein [Alkalihalobacillus sp. NPDC078783]|uniref:FtsK/SpoIIIE domain-containing protein n=1 Tax=Streptomyces albidoflavus TaxID=1886 RepID=UPI0034001EC2
MFTALNLKRKLVKVFRAGELHLKYRNGTNTQYIYPKIHSAKVFERYTQYVFTVPMGLAPSDVLKKKWLFENAFGLNTELVQDNKRFVLTIHNQGLPTKLEYDYMQYEEKLTQYALPVLCGANLYGEIVAFDMVEYPHCLIAGQTGSGKSVFIRSVLATLLQSCSPDKLHIFASDLKRSEFHFLRNIEHVKTLTFTKEGTENLLIEIENEMTKRGDLLNEYGAMHIDHLPEDIRPPYILICIDEVVLLKDEKESMRILEIISSIGRSLGCFLILAMQRPDSKLLEGALKNNLSVRMGFRAADASNAKIIGTPGSNKITMEQRGRFILALNEIQEIQAPYLSDTEAKKLLKPFILDKPKVAVLDDTEPAWVSAPIKQEESIFGLLEGDSDESER